MSSSTWQTAASWSTSPTSGVTGSAVPTATDSVVFNQSSVNGAETVTTVNTAITGITFANSGTTLLQAINGTNVLTLGAGGLTVNSGAGAVTISGSNVLNLALTGSESFTNNSGSLLLISRGVTSSAGTGTQTLTVAGNGTGNTSFGGVVGNGTGTLALAVNTTGGGITTVSNANTFTGGTTLQSGVLNVGGAQTSTTTGALGALSANSISFAGGTLQYSAANQYDYSPYFSTAAGQLYSIDTNSQNVTYASALTSSGGTLTKLGAGTLTLSGANTYTGATTINAGTLNVGSAENAGTSGPLGQSAAANPGSIVFGGGTLQYSAANQNDYSGRFSTADNQAINIDTNGQSVAFGSALTSNNGTLTKLGAGTLTLNGVNTYSGSTTITTGTLTLGSSDALDGGGNITMNGGTLAASQNVTLGNTIAAAAIGTTMSFGGSHNITTSGNLTFSGTPSTAGILINNMTNGATLTVQGITSLNNSGTVAAAFFGGAGNTSLDTIYGAPGSFGKALGSSLSYYGTGTLTLNGTENATGLENYLGGTVVANENGDGSGTIFGSNFVTSGSNIVLSGTPGTNATENLGGFAVAGSALLSYQSNISATPGSGNTINLGTLQLNSGVSTAYFQTGVASTTSGSGIAGTSNLGNTGIYGGWAVAGNGLNSEDFAVNLMPSGTGTSAAIVGLPTYLYSVVGRNTAFNELISNQSGLTGNDNGNGNFTNIKFDTSNGTAAGGYTFTRSNALFNTDGGSENLLFTGFGNFTVAGNAMTQNIPSSSTVNGFIYLQQYGTGTLTINNNLYGTGTFTNAGVGSANPVNGNVSGVSGPSTGTLVKSGPGTVVLGGVNNYVGNTFINGGTLSISTDSNLGGISGTLTVLAATTNSTTVTVSGLTAAQLSQTYVGATFLGTTITNQSASVGGVVTLTLATAKSASTGATPYANGTQLVELNGGTLQDTGSGTVTLGETNGTVSNYRPITLGVNGGTIDVTSTNTLVAPGIIAQTSGGTGQLGNIAGQNFLTKVNTGTLVLAGANTYTGGTNINGGTLKLDFNATTIANFTPLTSNILAAGGAVSLGGGTLNISDASTAVVDTQTIASLALTGGNNTVSMTHNAATSSTLTVTNGALNRTAGSTVDFISPTGTNIVLSGNTSNPFIGNYAFFSTGANQGYAATNGTGTITAAATTAATGANNFTSSTANYAYTSPGATDTLTGSATANTVIFNTAGPQTIDLGGGANTLTLNGLLNNTGALTIQRTGGTGTVVIGSTGELIIGGASNVTISAPISGAGGALTDSNTGTLALSGANTFTGPTTVNSGTLALTGGSLTGSNIKTVGAAVVTQSASNVIAGSGTTFTQASTGTSTLAGTNTYTGLTSVVAGELDLSSAGQSVAGNVAVSGGTLKLTAANQIATTGSLAVSGGTANIQSFNQTLAGVQLTGGTLSGTTGVLTSNSTIDLQAGVDAAILGGSNGLTKSTTGVALITSANTYTGATTINGGVLYISAMNNLGASTSAIVLGGGTLYYTGAAATTTRGFTLTANSEIDSSSGGTGLTIATNGITGSGFTTTFGGTNSANGTTVTSGNTTVSGNITTGSGGIIDNQVGTLTLSGVNTFTGVTILNNGILNMGSGLALGGGGNITFSGGTLQYSNLNSSDVSSKIVNSSAAGGVVVIDTNSQTVNFGSALASTNVNGLSKVGLGDLVLSASNAYTGSTFLNAGHLILNNSGALTSGTGNVTFFGGTLQYTANNTTDYSSRIKSSTSSMSIDTNGQAVTFATALPSSNNAGLTKLGAGTLSLTAANLFTGQVVVANGTLQVGNGTSGSLAAADTVNFTSGTLNLNQAAGTSQSLGALTFTAGDGVVQSTYAGSGTNTTSFASLATRAVGATGNFVLNGGTAANNIINVPTIGTAGGGELGTGYFFNGSSYAVNGAAATVNNGVVNGPVRAIVYGTDPGTITNGTTATSITNPTGGTNTGVTTATSTSATTTNNSNVLTGVTTTGLAVGNPVSGAGIPAGAVITAIGSGQVTLSANATVTGTGTAVFGTSNTITVASTAGAAVGEYVSGTGIPANSYITSIGTNSFTISQYATAAASNIVLTYTTPFVQTTANVTAQTSTTMTDLNLSGTPTYTLGTAGTAATVKLDGILKSGTGASTIASGGAAGSNLTSLNTNDEIVIRTDTATDSLTISANILASGTNAVTKSGAGTLTLSGANTFSGTTTIDGGTLSVATINGSGSNLGSGNLVANGGGILSYTGNTAATTRSITFGSAGGEIDTTTAGQTLSISGTVATPISAIGTFGGAGNTTLSGVVSGQGGLTKTGSGTLTLSTATNTYIGPTSVTGGTLAVTSSTAAGSVTTVGGFSGGLGTAVLSGTGTLNGALFTSSANSNVGHLAPGVNTSGTTFGTVGTLTVGGAVTIGAGTALDFDLSASSTSTGNDLIAMTGTGSNGILTFGGSGIKLNVNASNLLTGSGNAYTLISGISASNISGISLGNISLGTITGGALTGDTATFEIIPGTTDSLAVYFTSNSITNGQYTLTTTAGGGSSVNVHVSGTTSLGTTIKNTGSGTQDTLNYTALTATAGSGVVGPVTSGTTSGTALAQGATSTPTATQTYTAGTTAGAVAVGNSATVSNNSGLAGPPALTSVGATVNVYNYANAKYAGTTLAFGNVHQGATVASQTVAIGNQTVTNASFQDSLNASATTGNSAVTATGFTNLGASTSGATTGNLTVGVNTAAATSLASTETLGLDSNGTAEGLGITAGGATVVGSPGTITTTGQVYSGLMNYTGANNGTWSTDANWTDSTNSGVHAAPGLDSGFTGVDTATFGSNAATSVAVGLNGAAPNLNKITFSSPGTNYTLAQNVGAGAGTSSVTLSGLTPSINVTNPGASTTAGTQTISAPVILGATTALNVAANQTLAISNAISSTGSFGLSNSGPGTTILSNGTGNTYSGPTTITGGSLFVNNASGSGTGSGAVTVGIAATGAANSGTLAGKGSITASTLVVNGGGKLSSGDLASQVLGTGLRPNGVTGRQVGGMTLASTAVTIGSSLGTANLTFALGSGTSGINGGTASGQNDFSNPNDNTTYLKLTGSTTINFAGSTSISLVDLTNTNGSNGMLTLRNGAPYVLINAATNTDYLNLVIATGYGVNTTYSLSQGGASGYVLGVYTGTGTFNSANINNAGYVAPISIAQYGADGVTPLNGGAGGAYPVGALYLTGGNLEVVPEPGTWALMIGGLALLVVIQRRRSKV